MYSTILLFTSRTKVAEASFYLDKFINTYKTGPTPSNIFNADLCIPAIYVNKEDLDNVLEVLAKHNIRDIRVVECNYAEKTNSPRS